LVVGAPVFGKDAPREGYLIDLTEKLKIKDRVIFTGFREDMPEIYSALDIFVLPSEADGCSRSLIEAMASGKASVATGSGGTSELVKDKETGFLVRPADEQAMADKIALLVRDKDLSTRMGRAARRRVEENFSIERNVAGIQKIYLEVMAK
jgi:glycosyltransferase involved in cell wall biosynthesis